MENEHNATKLSAMDLQEKGKMKSIYETLFRNSSKLGVYQLFRLNLKDASSHISIDTFALYLYKNFIEFSLEGVYPTMVGEKLIFKIMVSRLLANAFASQKNESRRFNLCDPPTRRHNFHKFSLSLLPSRRKLIIDYCKLQFLKEK